MCFFLHVTAWRRCKFSFSHTMIFFCCVQTEIFVRVLSFVHIFFPFSLAGISIRHNSLFNALPDDFGYLSLHLQAIIFVHYIYVSVSYFSCVSFYVILFQHSAKTRGSVFVKCDYFLLFFRWMFRSLSLLIVGLFSLCICLNMSDATFPFHPTIIFLTCVFKLISLLIDDLLFFPFHYQHQIMFFSLSF